MRLLIRLHNRPSPPSGAPVAAALPLLLPLLLLASPSALAAGARPVTPVTEGNCQAPSWSRNGARLAYEVNYHQRKVIELYVYTPGAGEPRKVQPIQRGTSAITAGFSGPTESVAHEASWGPAYIDRFVYSASNASKDYNLYIDQAGAIAPAPGTDGGPAWSPDGRSIAFTSARTGQGDLYLIDAHQIMVGKDHARGAGVDQGADAVGAAGRDHPLGAGEVDRKIVLPPPPDPSLGRHMKDRVAAPGGLADKAAIANIAHLALHPQALDLWVTMPPHYHRLDPLGQYFFDDSQANKTATTSNQDFFHRRCGE